VTIQRVLWQSREDDGHEWCELREDGREPMLRGTAVLAEAGDPWRIDYEIWLDEAGRTRRVRIDAEGGPRPVRIDLEADGAGRWTKEGDGAVVVDEPGAVDVDLGFSPSTNTLPIRRLAAEVAIGESREIAVAWVLFPSFEVVCGRQMYERTGERSWRYRSGSFVGDLTVDEQGLVETYAVWRAVARLTKEDEA
jgi:uncharacterized protein